MGLGSKAVELGDLFLQVQFQALPACSASIPASSVALSMFGRSRAVFHRESSGPAPAHRVSLSRRLSKRKLVTLPRTFLSLRLWVFATRGPGHTCNHTCNRDRPGQLRSCPGSSKLAGQSSGSSLPLQASVGCGRAGDCLVPACFQCRHF